VARGAASRFQGFRVALAESFRFFLSDFLTLKTFVFLFLCGVIKTIQDVFDRRVIQSRAHRWISSQNIALISS